MSIEEKQELPTGWKWTKLGDISEIISKGTTPTSVGHSFSSTGFPFLRAEDVQGGAVDAKKVKFCITEATHNALTRSQIYPGDFLITIAGTLGRVGYISQGSPVMNCNQAVAFVRLNSDIADPAFICYVCSLRDVMAPLLGMSAGGAIQNLNLLQVRELSIPFPALPEQKRISTILTEKMAAVEKARAAAEARLKAAKELPAAYLRQVFESDEAQGWPKKRMEEIAELLPSKSIATDGDVEVQAITTACLSEVGFLPTGIKTARMKSIDVPQCIVSTGEILIARSNTPELVGRVAMFGGEPHGVVASDLTIRVKPIDWNNVEFLTSYLSFLYLTGYWKDRAGGASGSMKKITRGQILAEKVPVPSHEEQQRIIVRIKDKSSGVQKLIRQLQDELTATKELPAALLRQAFSGEL